jgi:hypothetical protein
MKWALIIFLVHSPSGSVSTETVKFESKALCDKAVTSFRYPSQGGFRVLTTCVKTAD